LKRIDCHSTGLSLDAALSHTWIGHQNITIGIRRWPGLLFDLAKPNTYKPALIASIPVGPEAI
jgi:hypothetical protein